MEISQKKIDIFLSKILLKKYYSVKRLLHFITRADKKIILKKRKKRL